MRKSLCGALLVLAATMSAVARAELSAPAAPPPGTILLDATRPARASREICNPNDPLVMWDVVFSSVELDPGCKNFTPSDLVAGVKFMVVRGEHSLTVRYPESHPPIVTAAYDRITNGVVQRCVTVSMPDGLMLQKRVQQGVGESAVSEAEPYRTLYCENSSTCHRGTGECCCSSTGCNCFICYCTLGCANCTCDGEDGGFWPADSSARHPNVFTGRWRRVPHGHAELQVGRRETD